MPKRYKQTFVDASAITAAAVALFAGTRVDLCVRACVCVCVMRVIVLVSCAWVARFVGLQY